MHFDFVPTKHLRMTRLEKLLDDKYAIQLAQRLLRAASSTPLATDSGDGSDAQQPPAGKTAAELQTPGMSTTKVGGHAASKDSILALWREVHAAAATVADA